MAEASVSGTALGEVAVVTVLFNSGAVIAECVRALPAEVEAVLVDNASTDGGLAIALAARPEATPVRLTANRGFGGGCQAGAEATLRPWLLFLNPDARIAGPDILRLAQTASAPMTLVGPAVLEESGAARPVRRVATLLEELLSLMPSGRRLSRRLVRRSTFQTAPTDRPAAVDFVEGACFLVRRADLAHIGGFDPDLFLYSEEQSLAHRLRAAGGTVLYDPRATAWHIGGTSTEQAGAFSRYHYMRSRVLVERKVRGHLAGRCWGAGLLLAACLAVVPNTVAHTLRPRRRSAVGQLTVIRGLSAGIMARAGAPYAEA